jgi:ssDNA-binding Zn-finger/Zn-ribbon topoisomerase 1
MVRLAIYDKDEKLIEASVMTPQEAADKAREFVFLQGADPDHGGVGATKGFVRFEPVKLDNPTQQSRFLEPYKANFETLKRACKNGDLALMQCRWKKTDSPVAVICAVERLDGGNDFKPMGMMFVANPYELVVPDVGEVNRVPPTDGERLLAELHELEGRAHAIRQTLQRGASAVTTVAVLPLTVHTTVEGGVLNNVEVVDATGAAVAFTHDLTDFDEIDCGDAIMCPNCKKSVRKDDVKQNDAACPQCGYKTGDHDGAKPTDLHVKWVEAFDGEDDG